MWNVNVCLSISFAYLHNECNFSDQLYGDLSLWFQIFCSSDAAADASELANLTRPKAIWDDDQAYQCKVTKDKIRTAPTWQVHKIVDPSASRHLICNLSQWLASKRKQNEVRVILFALDSWWRNLHSSSDPCKLPHVHAEWKSAITFYQALELRCVAHMNYRQPTSKTFVWQYYYH